MEADAKTNLEHLRAELDRRGWTARLHRDRVALQVCNPAEQALNETVVCADQMFRWASGQDIGPTNQTALVADRIMHVLREATGQSETPL
jgi:hypothetical protein